MSQNNFHLSLLFSLFIYLFIYLFSVRDIINLATGKDCVHHFTGIVEPTIDQVPTCSWSL